MYGIFTYICSNLSWKRWTVSASEFGPRICVCTFASSATIPWPFGDLRYVGSFLVFLLLWQDENPCGRWNQLLRGLVKFIHFYTLVPWNLIAVNAWILFISEMSVVFFLVLCSKNTETNSMASISGTFARLLALSWDPPKWEATSSPWLFAVKKACCTTLIFQPWITRIPKNSKPGCLKECHVHGVVLPLRGLHAPRWLLPIFHVQVFLGQEQP